MIARSAGAHANFERTQTSSPARAQDAFYQATAAEIENGAPGSIIREEPMRATPPGGIAHRVLYRSTSPEGNKIAVSGVIITPPGEPPQGGWPVVAWAHPTTGIVPRCAPSLAIFVYQQIAGSRPLTEKGYAIAAVSASRPANRLMSKDMIRAPGWRPDCGGARADQIAKSWRDIEHGRYWILGSPPRCGFLGAAAA